MNNSISIFDPSLFPSTNRPPANLLTNRNQLLSSTLLCIVSLLVPPGPFRQSLVIYTIFTLLYVVRQTSLPIYTDNYMSAVHLTLTLIRWIDFTLLHDPTTFVRTAGPHNTPIETPDDIKSYPLHRKLLWSISLNTTYRGTSFNWRVKNTPTIPPSTTRLRAILTHLLLILKYTLILDLRDYLHTYTILLTPQTPATLFHLPLWHQLLYTHLAILNSAAGIGVTYHIPALLLTLTHLTTPHSWPSVFGSWSSATTVRGAWGNLWHQYFRRWFEVFNTLLLNTLHIRRGTLLSKYIQIYFAFLLSAIFHHIAALNCVYVPSVRHQFLFFMLQPVCITIEDIAIAFGKRVGIKNSTAVRVMGYLWTFTAISFTGRHMAAYASESGIMLAPNPILFRFWERVMPLVGLPGVAR